MIIKELIDKEAIIDESTIIYPNVIIKGKTVIGKNCVITPGSYIEDSIIGDNVTIYSSYIRNSKIENDVMIGPYSNIRTNSVIKCKTKVGSFCEVKKTILNENSKIPHLSYVGDSIIGTNTNIGAGVITANYDGKNKHQTIIGNNAFIGSNTTIIAPVEIGDNTLLAAGSTITDDVPSDSLAIARNRQTTKKDYYKSKNI